MTELNMRSKIGGRKLLFLPQFVQDYAQRSKQAMILPKEKRVSIGQAVTISWGRT
ncbi:MAG: hypothetical protein ABSA12_16075 [Verrucomicrobiia bacterium]|jgi:hypothetical protein